MGKEVITLPNAPKLPLSAAVRAGDFIFVSGQFGFVDSSGKEIEGIEAQTRQCLEKIKLVLSAAGSSLNDVYRSYFHEDYPVRTTAITNPAIPNMLIEIECIAYSTKKHS